MSMRRVCCFVFFAAMLHSITFTALADIDGDKARVEKGLAQVVRLKGSIDKVRAEIRETHKEDSAAIKTLRTRESALMEQMALTLKPLCKSLQAMIAEAQERGLRPAHPEMKKLRTQMEVVNSAITYVSRKRMEEVFGISPRMRLELGNGVSMDFVLIPPGEFMMGSDSRDNEKPVHRVRITKPFLMAATEVTQKQYEAVMGKNPSHLKGADKPVETVSWNDASEFCKRLSQKTGKTVRLPTEAEWEYACRAGSTGEYCFGNSERKLGDYAWYSGNSDGKTHSVAQNEPNAWSLYDMHGNAREWCADWYSEYPAGDVSDPTGPSIGSYRVLRGGSCGASEDELRSAYRYHSAPGYGYIGMGFRVAMSMPCRQARVHGGKPEAGVSTQKQPLSKAERASLPKMEEQGLDRVAKLQDLLDRNRREMWKKLDIYTEDAAEIRTLRSRELALMEEMARTVKPLRDSLQAAIQEGQKQRWDAKHPEMKRLRQQLSDLDAAVFYVPRERAKEIFDMTLDLGGGVKMEFVLIPAGQFMMGSNEWSDEEPAHRVRITKPFLMAVTEVTQAQWKAVMGSEPWNGKRHAGKSPDSAANYILWSEATEFCKRLGQKTGRLVRLPTEAEWEYACRAASTGKYCFGDDEARLGEYAWYEDNAELVERDYAQRVAQKEPNVWGLYDMHGNVFEWCQDNDGSYPAEDVTDPVGPSTDIGGRVLRGGSWECDADCTRSASRRAYAPEEVYSSHGFRVVYAQ